MPLTKIPDLMRPDVCAARAAVHWGNARAALSLAIQYRDAGDSDMARRCFDAARQCADLASHYRRRLAVLAGRDAAIGAAVHRDGLVG
jgi:hypothetical protein